MLFGGFRSCFCVRFMGQDCSKVFPYFSLYRFYSMIQYIPNWGELLDFVRYFTAKNASQIIRIPLSPPEKNPRAAMVLGFFVSVWV